MLKRLAAVWIAIFLAFSAAEPASAQGFLGLFNPIMSEEEVKAAESAEIADEATRVSGIVLDEDGNVVREEGSNASIGAPMPMPMGTDSLMSAQTEAQRFREALEKRLEVLPAAFNEVRYILRASSPTGKISLFWNILRISLFLFLAGWLFERFVFGPLFGPRLIRPLIKEKPVGYTDKLPYLLIRLSFGTVGIIVSMVVAYFLGAVLYGRIDDTAVSFTVLVINVAYFAARFVSLLWRMILAPFIRQYRIPPFSDRNAKKLFYWLSIVGTLDIFSLTFTIWIAELGLNYNVYALFAAAVGFTMAIAQIALILANRRAVSVALRRGLDALAVSFMLRLFSVLWAPVMIAFFIASWFGLVFRLVLEQPSPMPPIVAAYSVLLAMITVYAILSYFIERFFSRARLMRQLSEPLKDDEDDTPDAEDALAGDMSEVQGPPAPGVQDGAEVDAAPTESPAPKPILTREAAIFETEGPDDGDGDGDGDEEGAASALPMPKTEQPEATGEFYSSRRHQAIFTFEDLAHRVAGILTLVIGLVVAGYISGAQAMFTQDAPLERALDIVFIIFFGYVAYHAFRVWVDGKILEETGGEVDEAVLGDEGAGASASRLATLLPLFRNTALVVIVIAVLLIILLELGINVSPLFAGAGVVGLAIGFGAQSLVRDIFSGAFFLFDDAFRKGEYIDIGGVKGTVERISVRSFQLRHHLGPLHTIPFGEIQFLTNYSRDWVIMKLPLRVTYDTDVEKVRKLIKKLGVSLLDDPVIGHNFIQPLKSQGVIEMQDSAMIIRVKFMTKPGDQWLVRKRVFQDIRDLFEREGIKFAHREVTVRLADGDKKAEDLSEEEKQAIGAAARSAVEEEQPVQGPKDDR